MKIDADKALSPGRRLRKLLKSFSAHPSPEDVHALRTQTRKLEAALHVLFPGDEQTPRRLLKLLAPMRKAAGRVRDMDVLIAKVSALAVDPDRPSLVKLVDRMARVRRTHAKRLAKAVASHGKRTRKLLKSCMLRIRQTAAESAFHVSSARVRALAAEIDRWPKLSAGNLHEFRLRAKEIWYILRLSSDADPQAVDLFGRVKDAAGEWHDWLELKNLAQQVLIAHSDGAALRAIRRTAREKLRDALIAANALRNARLANAGWPSCSKRFREEPRLQAAGGRS